MEKRNDCSGEIDFIERVLKQDHKNYHLWTYRVWLCAYFKLFKKERQYIEGWISKDVMNNTAWTYRHYLNSNDPLT
jgi:protein farnesyltransferase/geranylgeranyltransferase type-1 subunit alpha